MPFCPSQLFGG
jgi:hypothetical protein